MAQHVGPGSKALGGLDDDRGQSIVAVRLQMFAGPVGAEADEPTTHWHSKRLCG